MPADSCRRKTYGHSLPLDHGLQARKQLILIWKPAVKAYSVTLRGPLRRKKKNLSTERTEAAAAVIPARFRRVPRFVGVARRVNWPVFSLIVTSFFDRQRWPAFSALPRAFQNFCGGARVGPEDADDDLPGFAPEWLFHLREMDDRLFWATVERFFAEKRFPAWQQLPAEYTAWLKTLNVREFDYPASESVPDGATKPSDAYMDRRLMLTKKEGPKNRKSFPLTEDLIRGVMHSLKFE
ncbi:Protein of unknown function [Gryllus bimaculatus]|nr:Protein of unknown function [Gryllus bimaculatus]